MILPAFPDPKASGLMMVRVRDMTNRVKGQGSRVKGQASETCPHQIDEIHRPPGHRNAGLLERGDLLGGGA